MMEAQQLMFKDDGSIPNSKFPLLVYKNAFIARNEEGARWLEEKFASHHWIASWRNGVYPYHHYHSTAHEVLGVYAGSATLHMGGQQGQKIEVEAGDVLVIPAGVGHKNVQDHQLKVVGAYYDGKAWDVNRGLAGERPKADKNIAVVPVPDMDPLLGKTGLPQHWKS